MKKYAAVLFDLNGVLILDKPGYQPTELENKILKRMGLSCDDQEEKEKIKKEFGWREKDFWVLVNKSWEGAMPNRELIAVIKKIRKQKFKTAIVTNTSGLIVRPVIKNYFGTEISNLFDAVIISSEVGLLKPDQKIYQLCLNNLGLAAEESIYIDDAEKYLEGAKSIGMKTFLFLGNENLTKKLKELGIAI